MNIFKPLKDAFRRPPQTSNPYGLKDSEIAALRRLRSSDDYQVLRSALDKLVTLHSEALLASESSYKDSAIKNQIVGMRRAGSFVDEVILRVDSKREDERKRSDRSESNDATQRRRALYGTPFATRRTDLFG